jgi:RHS repeat-associated protein
VAAVDQMFGFTGQELDAATGLYNYNARWYDPAMGRFISEDPSGFDAGDANFYRYVGNVPIGNTGRTSCAFGPRAQPSGSRSGSTALQITPWPVPSPWNRRS